jgi:hypothetical protein
VVQGVHYLLLDVLHVSRVQIRVGYHVVKVLRVLPLLLCKLMPLIVTNVELQLVVKLVDLGAVHGLNLCLRCLGILYRVLHSRIQVSPEEESPVIVYLITCQVAAHDV